MGTERDNVMKNKKIKN